MSTLRRKPHFLLMATALILSLVGAGLCESSLLKDKIKAVSSSEPPPTTFKPDEQPLKSAVTLTTSVPTTKKSLKTTKAYETTESPPTTERHSTKVHASKKEAKSAGRQKLNSSSNGVGGTPHSPAKLQERLAAIDCDLPVLPRESRLWRGNETHEINLPVTVSYF